MIKTPKKFIALLSGAAFLMSSAFAQGVATDPVGYVTEVISPGTFNFLGFNLSQPVVAAGAFESATSTTLIDAEGDFVAALSEAGQHFVKLTDGSDVSIIGINTEVSAASATALTVNDDLSSVVVSGTAYEVRKSLTVGDIFGESNELDLEGAIAGDRTNADVIWIPDASGGFTQVFYNATPGSGFGALSVGWKSATTGNSDAVNTPIYFTSGVFIQVKRTSFDPGESGYVDANSKNLVISGAVQTEKSQVVLEEGFNFISRVFPGGVTLADSDLETIIEGALAGNRTNADIIWIPDGVGGYDKYFYNSTAGSGFGALSVGWRGATTGDADASSAELKSGVIIERKGSPVMVVLNLAAGVTL